MRSSIVVVPFAEHHWHDNVREDELSRTKSAIWGVERKRTLARPRRR
jgi:hypothetical protein